MRLRESARGMHLDSKLDLSWRRQTLQGKEELFPLRKERTTKGECGGPRNALVCKRTNDPEK